MTNAPPRGRGRRRLVATIAALAVASGLAAGCGVDTGTKSTAHRPVPDSLPQSPAEAAELRERLSRVVLDAPSATEAGLAPAVPMPAPQALLPDTITAAAGARSGLRLPQRFGVYSYALVLTPKEAAERPCALIWHDGHGTAPLEAGGDVIASTALNAGCTVVALAMPWRGWNRNQVATTDDGSRIDPQGVEPQALHDELVRLDEPGRSALDLFITPVVQVVNHLMQGNPRTEVSMAGLSGGGWTTTVAAAVDPRIQRSLAIAGSTPIRALDTCTNDYEQCHEDLLAAASMEQMYALSAISDAAGTGPGAGSASGEIAQQRVAADVLNFFDTCCYSGVDGSQFAAQVQQSVTASGGGKFVFKANTTLHGHAVPPEAIKIARRWFPPMGATSQPSSSPG